jgi:hypothetical protein
MHPLQHSSQGAQHNSPGTNVTADGGSVDPSTGLALSPNFEAVKESKGSIMTTLEALTILEFSYLAGRRRWLTNLRKA